MCNNCLFIALGHKLNIQILVGIKTETRRVESYTSIIHMGRGKLIRVIRVSARMHRGICSDALS